MDEVLANMNKQTTIYDCPTLISLWFACTLQTQMSLQESDRLTSAQQTLDSKLSSLAFQLWR